jgi:SAM-dependent methyltransferase
MWYSKIADLYDGLVQFDEDIPFFIDYCTRANGHTLELMAGTGRVSISLLEAGFELTCVDSSAQMLDRLCTKLSDRSLEAKIILEDVRFLNLPQEYEAAIIPFNSFSEIIADSDRIATLRSVFNCLVDGGYFICTLHNPTFKLKSIYDNPRVKFRFPHPSGKGEVLFDLKVEYYPHSHIVSGVQTFDIYSDEGDLQEQRQVDIRYCLPTREWFSEAACETGFTIESLFGDFHYSDYHKDVSPYMIWVLRKPDTFSTLNNFRNKRSNQ